MVIKMTDIIIWENQSIVTFNNVPASYENSFICAVLEQAAAEGINIDMIAQSPATSDKISFGFTFGDDDMTKLLKIINSKEKMTEIQPPIVNVGNVVKVYKSNNDISSYSPPLINSGNVKVTVKSREMVDNTGFASKVFSALKKLGCLPLLVTTGVDEISMLIHHSVRVDLEKELRDIFS
ncbi:MAG: aspartate kinase [Oscillospiraceae bacterium]|nr:aspartate kinase [Oscillospiraceae bacterium]